MTVDDDGPPTAFRRWHGLWRSAYEFEHAGRDYLVDIHYFAWEHCVRLYEDGVRVAVGDESLEHILDDGSVVEVKLSTYGTRHARLRHLGVLHDFTPVAGSSEAWRDHMHEKHPVASRAVGAVSWTVLAVAAILLIPQLWQVLAEFVDALDPDAVPYVDLPPWANTGLTVAGVMAGIERALRRRYNPLLD